MDRQPRFGLVPNMLREIAGEPVFRVERHSRAPVVACFPEPFGSLSTMLCAERSADREWKGGSHNEAGLRLRTGRGLLGTYPLQTRPREDERLGAKRRNPLTPVANRLRRQSAV